MSYKIAVGTSDGVDVDLKFGQVKAFFIYEVTDEIKLLEKRKIISDNESNNIENNINKNITNDTNTDNKACKDTSCNNGSCSGNGGGCGGASEVISRVEKISDCRCVVCKKVGFQAQKQFEKKAISVFDVECKVLEALIKISDYYLKKFKELLDINNLSLALISLLIDRIEVDEDKNIDIYYKFRVNNY